LLSLPRDMAKIWEFLGQNMLDCVYVENRKPGPLLKWWTIGTNRYWSMERLGFFTKGQTAVFILFGILYWSFWWRTRKKPLKTVTPTAYLIILKFVLSRQYISIDPKKIATPTLTPKRFNLSAAHNHILRWRVDGAIQSRFA